MDIYLYGCHGHAKVILDTLHRQGRRVSAIVDDNPPPNIHQLRGVPVQPAIEMLPTVQHDRSRWIVALSDNLKRQAAVQTLSELGHSFTTAIHPSANIAAGVQIAPGAVVMANAVIDSDTQIGAHVIVNTGATIGHDCIIDSYCHISPGCTICGQVRLQAGVFLEVGTSVCSQVEIGQYTTCGAGSVVVHSLPPHCLASGCPAKAVQSINSLKH